MNDPRRVIPVEADPFAQELDRLIDGARGAEIPDEGIAAVLEDRAERERRRVEAAGQ